MNVVLRTWIGTPQLAIAYSLSFFGDASFQSEHGAPEVLRHIGDIIPASDDELQRSKDLIQSKSVATEWMLNVGRCCSLVY